MRKLILWAVLLFAGFVLNGLAAADWPQWRGPLGTGVAPTGTPPLEWNTGHNILWKTKISGRGHASPVVSGDMIFLTTSIPVGEPFAPRMSGRPGAHDNSAVTSTHQFQALGISVADGSIKWRTTLAEAAPLEGGHNTASLASASPVTDGKHVYVSFGSQGLYCLTRDGKLVWKKQLGKMHTKHGHGEGSSPALSGQTLVVNWDHEGDSFLTALDTATGEERWRIARNEVTSWSTPLITEVNETKQVIVCGTDRVRGYRLSDGKILWECGGMSANIVATPVAADGILYVGSSYEKRVLMAIRLSGATGDITGTDQVLWTRYRGTPYVPSPLLYNGALYFLTHYQNVITRVVAETGDDAPGAIRLGPLSNIYASPVAANGHIYITDLNGKTLVITDTEIPRSVSINPIGEAVSASLAIHASRIFIRGQDHLFCIATE
jgi:outer membrane protein assembly factor BamB